MKLSFILVLLSAFQAIAFTGNSQERISLNVKNQPLSAVIKKIEADYNYRFVYSDSVALAHQKVNLQVREATIEQVMQQLLVNTRFDFRKMNRNLLVIVPASGKKQELTVRGTVTDTLGNPLSGVSILEKGTSNGTVTDAAGNFSLKLNSNTAVLVVSSVGFESREILVTGEELGSIVLVAAEQKLDEIIVIGYGTTTRKQLIGAVDQISSKNIQDRPVGNLTQALQGAAPSLLIQQKSMDPNNNALNINIRGVNTLTSADPLVVIDGMISDVSNMNKLNPNDVDKISVLKDAGSAAIYGSRSASGVIVITTKNGRKNSKPKVRLGASYGSQQADILYRPVEGWQNATLLNVALANGGQAPAYTPEQIQDLKAHGDAEWMMDYIFKDAPQQAYDVNISGGSANSTYMISGGYYNQGSNFIGPNYGIKRYNLRTKLTTEYKRFKADVFLGFVRTDIKGDESNQGFKIADASRTPKYYYNVPKTDDGRYLISSVGTNVAAQLDLAGYNRHNNDWMNIGTNLEFKITNDLKARAVFGADITSNWRFIRRLEYPTYNSPESTTPVMNGTNRETENYAFKGVFINSQVLLDYNKKINKHNISAMAGVSQEVLNNRGIDVKTSNTDPDLGIPVNNGEDDKTIFDNSRTEVNNSLKRVIQSGFGRVNYNYDDRYSVEFTLRADGSSRFPKENRWGSFPSVSLGWSLSEEDFLSNYRNNIGNIKLRGSWGILGNQEIADFQYFTTYTIYANAAGFGNSPVSGTGFQEASPDLKWEKVNSTNIGLDLDFLKRALNVSFDVFLNKTTDILLTPITPSVYGTILGDVNIGSMQNRGWELNLGYNLSTGDFIHNIALNLGNTQNKALDLGNPEIRTVDNIGFIRRNGLPLGAYYGLKTDGLFQSNDEVAASAVPIGTSPQPGDVKYVDRNNDGVIDNDDRFYLGDGFPHYNYGFSYNLRYKSFDFALLIQGVGKRLQSLRGDIYTPFHNGGWYPVIFKHQLDTWTVTNTDARFPRLNTNSGSSYSNNWGQASDLYLLDASYIRIKNIQLGYSLPQEWVSRIGFERVRIYANAQNPVTISRNSFIDPESTEFDNMLKAGGGNSGRNYPTLKFYGAGINIEF
ncbi:SusC/RagA family TonB-linked outer membrane protein [Niabella terrae]